MTNSPLPESMWCNPTIWEGEVLIMERQGGEKGIMGSYFLSPASKLLNSMHCFSQEGCKTATPTPASLRLGGTRYEPFFFYEGLGRERFTTSLQIQLRCQRQIPVLNVGNKSFIWANILSNGTKGASSPTDFEWGLVVSELEEADANSPGTLLSPEQVSKMNGILRSLWQIEVRWEKLCSYIWTLMSSVNLKAQVESFNLHIFSFPPLAPTFALFKYR